MENNLTLEHLAPYLPYGLKMSSHGRIYILNGFILESAINIQDNPILRPLSDLSKNKNFWRVVSIMDDNFSEYVTVDSDCDIEVECDGCFARCVSLHDCYKAYTELFKNHFDVFGLIEKGLAVDVNTIKNA